MIFQFGHQWFQCRFRWSQGIFKSSPRSAAYIRQWIVSALVQIMACRLFGAKPSSKPVLGYHQLDHQEQNSVQFESEFYHFNSRKFIWKRRLPEWPPFCPGGDELNCPTWPRAICRYTGINTLRPKQNNWYFADGISNSFSWRKLIQISPKFLLKDPIKTIPH